LKASPDHSTTETVFTARGLSKVYAVGEMEVRALHDVDLDVYAHVEPGGFTKISTLGVEEQRVNVIVDILSPREAWLDLGDAFQIDARIEVLTVDDALVVCPLAPCSAKRGRGTPMWCGTDGQSFAPWTCCGVREGSRPSPRGSNRAIRSSSTRVTASHRACASNRAKRAPSG
jgi:hypothetical protein